MKRVYDRVAVARKGAGYGVMLDSRELRTPAKKILTLPTHALAVGVALEWEAQGKHMRPDTMPLMRLATTATDQFPDIRPLMTSSMVRCVESDLACFRTIDEPQLVSKEMAAFDPLLEWVEKDFGLRLSVSDGLALSHSPDVIPRVEELLASTDDWELTALDAITSSSKSLVVALALLRGRIDAETAVAAARVAEQHQIDEWGEVEAGHDLDAADIAVRIGASSAFLRMLGK